MIITDRIHISCPHYTVWAATVDIETWPEWSPVIQEARLLDGPPLGVGSLALLKQPAQPRTVWRVVEFDAGQRFVWETSGNALHMRAEHSLRPCGEGTECTLNLQVLGSLSWLIAPVLYPAIRIALRRENSALKDRCEFHTAANRMDRIENNELTASDSSSHSIRQP